MKDVTNISETLLRKIIEQKIKKKSNKKTNSKPAERLFGWGNALKIDTFLDEKLVAKIIAKKLHEASPGAGESKEDLPIPDSSDTLNSFLSTFSSPKKIEEPEEEPKEEEPKEEPKEENRCQALSTKRLKMELKS